MRTAGIPPKSRKGVQDLVGLFRKLPPRKRALFAQYLSRLGEILSTNPASEEDREEFEQELGELQWAIDDLFDDSLAETRPYLVPPDSPAVKKAHEWFAKLAAQIRKLRLERGMTQVELAKRSGLSQTAISRFENGSLMPGQQGIERLAAALGVKPAEIDPGWNNSND